MSYQSERDEFITRMSREDLDLDVIRRLLRAATTMQRYAELACSSEAADRDRIPCPATKIKGKAEPCCCGFSDGAHTDVPRITVLDHRLERRIAAGMPEGWAINTQGDPRGYVLRVIPPSYAERNATRKPYDLDAIGVPSGPTGLRF